MRIAGNIEISYKIEKEYIYQCIRIIPNAMKNLGYFIKDKYRLAQKIDTLLMKQYLGDAENILFVENNRFRNMNTIKYQIINPEFTIDLSPKKFYIEADIPATDSCLLCKFMRPLKTSKDKIRCLYYKDFIKSKIHCIDFVEK